MIVGTYSVIAMGFNKTALYLQAGESMNKRLRVHDSDAMLHAFEGHAARQKKCEEIAINIR